MYSRAKDSLVDAIKLNARDSKKQLYREAVALAKFLPKVFSDDLKEKLTALALSADQPLENRKPLIEKALITTRKYVQRLNEFSDEFSKYVDEIGDSVEDRIDSGLTKVMVATLMRIQAELIKIYHSKPQPINEPPKTL